MKKDDAGWAVTLRGMGSDWLLPAAVVAMVFVMLVPVPSLLLDLLLALSLTASVLVLLTSLNILKPVDFSVFPSLLLLLTLMRLSLNLASSRRILLHGSEGASAAGRIPTATSKPARPTIVRMASTSKENAAVADDCRAAAWNRVT